jgi:hypothetical protein
VLALYRALLALRRDEPALRTADRAHFEVAALDDAAGAGALALRRSSAAGDCLLTVVSFGASLAHRLDADAATRAPEGARWARVLSTEEARFGGAEADVRDGTVDVVALGAPGAVVLRAAAAPHAVRAA